MSTQVEFHPELSWTWRCDGCAVESAPMTHVSPVPVGWASFDRHGERGHLCPPCRIALGLASGFNDLRAEA